VPVRALSRATAAFVAGRADELSVSENAALAESDYARR